jgi:hypothetical protein
MESTIWLADGFVVITGDIGRPHYCSLSLPNWTTTSFMPSFRRHS